MEISNTPEPPYYAVIFTSIRTEGNQDGYGAMADKMEELANEQDGFLGIESARNEVGITVSYWRDLDSIKQWKENPKHLLAQQLGKKEWYTAFDLRICKVEKAYSFKA
jgi:heme-degrading monooxygenase HmoA